MGTVKMNWVVRCWPKLYEDMITCIYSSYQDMFFFFFFYYPLLHYLVRSGDKKASKRPYLYADIFPTPRSHKLQMSFP